MYEKQGGGIRFYIKHPGRWGYILVGAPRVRLLGMSKKSKKNINLVVYKVRPNIQAPQKFYNYFFFKNLENMI
jgi:hypothetical protein